MPVFRDKMREIDKREKEIEENIVGSAIKAEEKDAEVIQEIAQAVAERHRDSLSTEGMTSDTKEAISKTISDMAAGYSDDYAARKKIERLAAINIMGYGPIETYLNDPEVNEIIVQRYDNICIEKNGVIKPIEDTFTDESHLRNVINRIVQPVGRQINISTPIVDARLSDGSRVNATIPPASPDGATLTIRLFSDNVLTGKDYLRLRSLNEKMLHFLAFCVKAKVSIIVSGGTSTGKTCLLNMLSLFVPDDELIITIEDSCELQLNQRNVRRLEARQNNNDGVMPITIQTLVKNALRMRPDRIIVGEIRDGTVVDMMTAMSTGHEGSMSTVHANNPEALVNTRLPILYSMYESAQFSEISQARQISDAIQLIVHISRLPDGSRKITHITHVVGVKNDKVELKDIFVYNEKNDTFESTGYIPRYLLKHCRAHGVRIPETLFEKEV